MADHATTAIMPNPDEAVTGRQPLAKVSSDMVEVGDHEDCLRCSRLDEECGYHQGYGAGMAAAFQLMREVIEDPETVTYALARRDQHRQPRRYACPICGITMESDRARFCLDHDVLMVPDDGADIGRSLPDNDHAIAPPEADQNGSHEAVQSDG